MSTVPPAKRRRLSRRQASGKERAAHDLAVAQSWPTLNSLALLYFFSGIPALLYQTVWQRLLVLHSGVGSVSVSIIVAAYMLGLGVGSLLGGQLSRRRSPRQLLWMFAGLEMAVAVYAYFSPFLMVDILYRRCGWLYDDMFTAALLHVVTLVLPTTFMGMTLPLLTSALTSLTSIAPRGISVIYGCNALGAATGALVAPWVLMPFVGVQGVCSLGAATNFLVAIGAMRMGHQLHGSSGQLSRADASANTNKETATATSAVALSFNVWAMLYFLSGFLAIGLEILWFRILDVMVKSSAYTFGTLLAVYLSCLAAGTLAGAWRTKKMSEPVARYLASQCAVVLLALVPILLLVYLPEQWMRSTWLFQYWSGSDPLYPTLSRWGAVLTLYVAMPVFVMGAATFCMGYSFAALQRGVQIDNSESGYRIGLLQAMNILGCVLGSLVVGLWWLDSYGTAISWQLLSGLGSLFALVGIVLTPHRTGFGLMLAMIVSLLCLMPDGRGLWLRLHGEGHGSAMVMHEDVSGVAVAAPESEAGQWRVSANGKSQSHLPFGGFHAKLGSLPTTLHAQPDSIAIIGLGSGNTAWAAACRTDTKRIKVFEVCTAELPLLESLSASGNHPQLSRFLGDPRLSIVGSDARYVLMTTSETYDIIETDAIRPHSAYAGYLYSQEFFELCRSRLKPGGLMCCWSPTPGTYSTFLQAFPHVLSLDQGYLLIGSMDPIALDVNQWKARVQNASVAEYLGAEIVEQCLRSIDSATTSAEQLSVPMINTDLFPFDEFH